MAADGRRRTSMGEGGFGTECKKRPGQGRREYRRPGASCGFEGEGRYGPSFVAGQRGAGLTREGGGMRGGLKSMWG